MELIINPTLYNLIRKDFPILIPRLVSFMIFSVDLFEQTLKLLVIFVIFSSVHVKAGI